MKIFSYEEYCLIDRRNFTGIVDTGVAVHYFLKGMHHREDGPALEWTDGEKRWYLQGEGMSEKEHIRRMAWAKTPVGKLILNEGIKV